MPQLSDCPSCQGFNPPSVTACLNCQHPLDTAKARMAPSWVASLWTIAGASAAALTLMACYGMPPCDDGTFRCYDLPPDCDLTDAGLHEGNPDAGDTRCTPLDAGTTTDAGTTADAGTTG
ncbi:hypothetical protein DRW03_04075 [Corallococcus sp. H22C18031201]|uniref:hypothetical protein n=1 Tax=Citreicoccus inhibens TaxID=2849499 RepID=UPI000E755694|nr:hypothetical protein [Citreicoccus inhibens]MBU8897772.1 hypothetical protein [Citreicoccus inhibens]RJS25668.1 hypothetical protein DRW03_04075 [Corallococcus sp. H22C18031201]